MPSQNQGFNVLIPKSCEPLSQVMDRIRCYMELQNVCNLESETMGAHKFSFFSHRLVEAMDSKSYPLPFNKDVPEWVIDFSLCHSEMEGNSEQNNIAVRICCFSHSSWGHEMVERITQKLQGDVCRTTRTWRRRMDRQLCLASANGDRDT